MTDHGPGRSNDSRRWDDGQAGGWDPAVLGVVDKELALLRPAVRGDPQTVVALLHPEFREFGASGRVWDRSRIAAALAADPGDRLAVAEDLQAARLAEDALLLTYRARRPDRVSLRSSLWVAGPEGWQLLFHQGTACP